MNRQFIGVRHKFLHVLLMNDDYLRRPKAHIWEIWSIGPFEDFLDLRLLGLKLFEGI